MYRVWIRTIPGVVAVSIPSRGHSDAYRPCSVAVSIRGIHGLVQNNTQRASSVCPIPWTCQCVCFVPPKHRVSDPSYRSEQAQRRPYSHRLRGHSDAYKQIPAFLLFPMRTSRLQPFRYFARVHRRCHTPSLLWRKYLGRRRRGGSDLGPNSGA